MNKKLYVGNLCYTTTEEELKTLFANYGEVESSKIIKDNNSGRSKGFGFIEMKDAEGAQKAREALNGFEFKKRKLTVDEAKEKEARSSSESRDDRPAKPYNRPKKF